MVNYLIEQVASYRWLPSDQNCDWLVDFIHKGWQTFYIRGGGGYDDVVIDEPMDVNKSNILASKEL